MVVALTKFQQFNKRTIHRLLSKSHLAKCKTQFVKVICIDVVHIKCLANNEGHFPNFTHWVVNDPGAVNV